MANGQEERPSRHVFAPPKAKNEPSQGVANFSLCKHKVHCGLIGAVGISVPSQYASMKYFTRATAQLGALINSAVLQGGVEKAALISLARKYLHYQLIRNGY